ncbi:MAG: hypothetical protein KatS3mg103_0340 [Phycisphaerales bacterium]|nr:MAG: hypothetical protein KatS3mg103_0340 [Phycisphaerales bacterium]
MAVLASAVLLVHAPPRPGRAMHAHDLGQDHPHRQPMPGSAWPADWQAGSIMPGSLGTLVGPHGVVRIRATAAGTRYDVLDARGRAVAHWA